MNIIKKFIYKMLKIEVGLALVTVAFSLIIYLLHLQIQNLILELENLTSILQSLEKTQIDLKNQILLKDHHIKFLENTLVELQFKFSALSHVVNYTPQSFELLKDEIIEINKNEMIQFFKKIGGVAISVFLVFVIINFCGKPVSQENFELSLLDSANELVWFVKIIDNKKAEIIIKNFDSEGYEYVEQFARTLILKSSDSISSGSLENIEIISSHIPATEKVIMATQITEIISSFGF